MIKVDLRAEFENIAKKKTKHSEKDFERDEQGKYKNIKVHRMWKGFQLYHNFLTIDVENGLGTYVISRVNDNGSFSFRPNPFRHSNRHAGSNELERLHQQEGQSFALFRCVKILEKKKETLTSEQTTEKIDINESDKQLIRDVGFYNYLLEKKSRIPSQIELQKLEQHIDAIYKSLKEKYKERVSFTKEGVAFPFSQ